MVSCDFCSRPASSTCVVCDTELCFQHAATHSSEIPEISHRIIALSPSEMSSRDIIERRASPDLQEEPDLDLMKTVLIESRYDVYQTSKIFKWGISSQETFKLLDALKAYNTVQVIGIYGNLSESFNFARELLGYRGSLQEKASRQGEGIIALFRPSTELLCLLYVTESEDLYSQKPFPQNSHKTIFPQLLIDLCPVIVCCPSNTIERNWYFSPNPQKANPFVSTTPSDIVFGVRLSQTELKIEKCEWQMPGNIYLACDHQPVLFTLERNPPPGTLMTKIYTLTMTNGLIRTEEVGSQQFPCERLTREPVFYAISSEASYVFFPSDEMRGLKFSHKGKAKSVALPALPLNSVLASGSTVALFALFNNAQRKAYYGSARDEVGIDDGNSLNVYGELVTGVLAACFQPDKYQIYLVNQEGLLFSLNLKSHAKALIRVTGTDRRVLTPQSGTRFSTVQSSKCESLLYLQSQCAIEIYKAASMELVTSLPVEGKETPFKVITVGTYEVVLVKNLGTVQAYRFQTGSRAVEMEVETQRSHADIAGNPMVDMIQYANLKYGCEKQTSQKVWFFMRTDSRNSDLERYCLKLPCFSRDIDWKGLISLSNSSSFVSNCRDRRVDFERFKWSLLTRSCVHLACIQEGNLLPLKDGFTATNIRSRDDIRFGVLEDILAKVGKLKVVSIMGKQSSGKSYLLNRLFGTRFDVSAARCTEGIWLSLSYIEGQIFVVLDCEGLFSSERRPIEETKMCLFLAAISDVTILNSDISFNRYILRVFDQYSRLEDLLQKPGLFRGSLEFALRDVPQHQNSGATEEALNHIHQLTRSDFLFHLFHGQVAVTSYHNFELKELFALTLKERQAHYLNGVQQRWQSGLELVQNMKVVLEYMAGQEAALEDAATQSLRLEEQTRILTEAVCSPEVLRGLLSSYDFQFATSLPLLKSARIINLNDINLRSDSSRDLFEEKLRSITTLAPETAELSTWHISLRTLIDDYFTALTLMSLRHFYIQIQNLSLSWELAKGKAEQVEVTINRELWAKYKYCEKKCQHCYLVCSLPWDHDAVCTCLTSHRCTKVCPDCPYREMCAVPAGHRENHKCARNHDAHFELRECAERCIMHSYCRNKCGLNGAIQHEIHNCQQCCPLPCSMPGCQMQCAHKDHIHSVRSKHCFFILQFFPKGKHICTNRHKCTHRCEYLGNCATQIESQTLTQSGFQYTKISQKVIRKACNFTLPPGEETHKIHCCDVKEHTCTATCPDCGVYCALRYSHSGPHRAPSHLSKTRCITWAATSHFAYEAQEDSTTVTRRLAAGSGSQAETCEACCSRKGRGHTHPVRCEGRSNCLATLYPQFATHSTGFYPDTSASIDLVECSKYWETKNWTPPLATNPNALALFRLCPYYCGAGLLKAYCSRPIFHSSSPRPFDHVITLNADIVFLVDLTVSMKYALPGVKQAIESVLVQLHRSLPTLTFSIITYCDHSSNPASVVAMCPFTGVTSDYNISQVTAFLRAAATQNAGREQRGEVTHAIYALSRLRWRESAYRLVYYFTLQGDIEAKYCACAGGSQTMTIKRLLDEYTKVSKVEITSKPADLAAKIVEDLYGNAKADPLTLELASK